MKPSRTRLCLPGRRWHGHLIKLYFRRANQGWLRMFNAFNHPCVVLPKPNFFSFWLPAMSRGDRPGRPCFNTNYPEQRCAKYLQKGTFFSAAIRQSLRECLEKNILSQHLLSQLRRYFLTRRLKSARSLPAFFEARVILPLEMINKRVKYSFSNLSTANFLAS